MNLDRSPGNLPLASSDLIFAGIEKYGPAAYERRKVRFAMWRFWRILFLTMAMISIEKLKLRNWYQPFQFHPDPANNAIRYVECLPSLHLRPYVHCYWELKTNHCLASPFMYRVIADGCVDFFFGVEELEQNFVMGFSKTHSRFPLGRSFHYIGVRFYPVAFSAFFGHPAAELRERVLPLDALLPRLTRSIQETLAQNPDLAAARPFLDDILGKWRGGSPSGIDPLLAAAMGQILESQGSIHMQSLDVGLSPRQVRRHFRHYLGGSAKSFARIIRFQHIVRALQHTPAHAFNNLDEDPGYSDQAHFCKEFKLFAGGPPSDFFGP